MEEWIWTAGQYTKLCYKEKQSGRHGLDPEYGDTHFTEDQNLNRILKLRSKSTRSNQPS
jgi:hypothetical protein